MVAFLLIVGAFVVTVPTTLYFSGRAAGRDVWGLFLQGYEKRGSGAYRAQITPVWSAGKPPMSVRLAAITSFILGQMVVPGTLAAILGLVVSLEMLSRGTNSAGEAVVHVLVLSAPTGLMIGGRLLTVGLSLLQRTKESTENARKLGRFSIIHNVVLLIAMAILYAFGADEAVWLTVVYSILSIAQASLLFRAARAVDEHSEAEERDRELAIRPPQWADNPA